LKSDILYSQVKWGGGGVNCIATGMWFRTSSRISSA